LDLFPADNLLVLSDFIEVLVVLKFVNFVPEDNFFFVCQSYNLSVFSLALYFQQFSSAISLLQLEFIFIPYFLDLKSMAHLHIIVLLGSQGKLFLQGFDIIVISGL